MRNRAALILAALILIVQLMDGSVYAQKAVPPKTLDIGIATPLTGPAAHLGINMKNAALMAIEDQNAQGGVKIAGQNYMLNPIVLDSKKDAAVGKAVAEQLIYDKKVKVVAGLFIDDAIGAQPILESNKVISFFTTPAIRDMTGPNKPYSFFFGGPTPQFFSTVMAYVQKFYPNAKTVVTMVPDLPNTPMFLNSVQMICKLYGLNWLGAEKFPFGTTDFSPMITRVLAKNPDIIDTNSTGGNMGGLCAQLIKQLRQAGYKGMIVVPALPPPGAVEEVVPSQYRTLIVTNDIDWEAPIVSESYRDLCRRYIKKYNATPIDVVGQLYNVTKPFYEFLNSQDTLDTAIWMERFANYRWKGIFGFESSWVGKPMFGINRMALKASWVSEYIHGKLETKWQAPIPMDLFVEKK
ncbi:MAG TPA: ABC transporter substrate-binding protein [Thermodesulfobacteriota bacterium]|nr:ABC transporter substrate-binding protein [Thermodesulfobacteriota bacterium]